jgi:hypothetical protein
LNTRYLLNEADRYLLPRPSWDDRTQWVECKEATGLCLTPGAIKALRSDIRKERAERRQDWQGALVWVSGLTGLVGVMTGLIAVWKK